MTPARPIHRDGLRQVIGYMDSRKTCSGKAPKIPAVAPRRKEIVWNTWQRFLDYMLALRLAEQYHARFHRLKGAARRPFLIGYTAMLTRYARAGIIDRVENNPELDNP